MKATAEVFDGSELVPPWRALDELERMMHAADVEYEQSNIFTDRRFDSNDRPGQRLYLETGALIGIARENQHLLERTMTGDQGAIYPRATLNLIRPSFEAAITAYWMLDPDEALERKIRGLRQSFEDHRQAVSSSSEVLDHPDTGLVSTEDAAKAHAKEADIAKRFRDDADELGLVWRTQIKTPKGMNIRDDLAKLSAVQGQPLLRQFLRYNWRLLSGVQHGLGYASVKAGQRLGEVAIPGGTRTVLVSNDSTLMNACEASVFVQARAMEAYIARTTSLTRPPAR